MRALLLSCCVAAAAGIACGGGSGGGSDVLPGTDATLSSLTASAGTLAPAFAPGTADYALPIPAGTTTITVTPTASDPHVHGIAITQGNATTAVASGKASTALTVPATGTSKVFIAVTAADGTTQLKYTLTLSIAVVVPALCKDAPALAPNDSALTEPSWPTSVCATLPASTTTNATTGLPGVADDTTAIQNAINGCTNGAVKLVVNSNDATKVAFVSKPLGLKSGVILWVDAGVTLFASQNPRDYDSVPGTPTCAVENGSSSGCKAFITASSTVGAGIVGTGIIDGLGGEPMVGGFNGDGNASWWDFAKYENDVANKSFSNPRLIDVKQSQGFTLYRITLHNSPKFHVGLESDPFTVWGVTILTPSRKTNSVGRALTAHGATNTDGIDPYNAGNGVIAYSTISTGDDQIALKCGDHHLSNGSDPGPSCRDIVIAHNHFGTGHGMSIGSETNAGQTDGSGVAVDKLNSAYGLHVYDLSIDGLLPNGNAGNVNLNGIRVKSDQTKGGIIRNAVYEDVCMRGLANPILLNPRYSSSSGLATPTFESVTIRNVHHVDCSAVMTVPAPVVTLNGYDATHVTGVTLDNVQVESLLPANVKAMYANVTLGPGPVNFTPSATNPGPGVTVTDNRAPGTSNACAGKFVAIPAPQ